MESSFVTATTAKSFGLFTICKALINRRQFSGGFQVTRHQCLRTCPPLFSLSNKTLSNSSPLRRSLYAVLPKHYQFRVKCFSSSASFGTGGGNARGDIGDGGGCGGGGGGHGGSEGGDSKSKLGGGGGEVVSALSTDVIILDVGGMTCGGCAASVKRILESQPQVLTASVNLTTETAIVWPVSEAKVIPNWQQQLGEALAKHLTSCGFQSNLRVAGEGAIEGDFSP